MALKIINSKNELVLDPSNSMQKYNNRKKQILEISKKNEILILQYISDMETGINVSPSVKKGPRSYSRLNTLLSRMKILTISFEKKFQIYDLITLSQKNVHELFTQMSKGIILTKFNKRYKSVTDYVKTFKAFWHWHMRKSKKDGIDVIDITEDLNTTSDEKPEWVYFNFEDLRRMADSVKFKYKVIMYFMFDSGLRSPHELVNIKGKDIIDDLKSNTLRLKIRNETTKTFGRKLKLMLCSGLLREHIKCNNISSEEFVFKISPKTFNQLLKNLGKKILNKDGLTMYDFRHNSACYWLPRYKSESALKYRFGWKKSEMIHYYTEFLGMKDTIQEDDLYIDDCRPELEKKMENGKFENEILSDKMIQMENQLKVINRAFLNLTIKPEVENGVNSNFDLTKLRKIAARIKELNLQNDLIKML